MAAEITKCPLCGTKLKMIDGRMGCKECGYFVRSQSEDPLQANAAAQEGASRFGAASASGMGKPSASQSLPKQDKKAKPKAKSGGKGGAVLGIIGGIAISVLVALFRQDLSQFLYHLFEGGGQSENDFMEEEPEDTKKSPTPYAITSAPSSADGSDAKENGAKTDAALPESDFFREMAEVIWGKSYREVTKEEYQSLTALQIDRDNKTIFYQLNYGDTRTLTYANDYGKELADLACFSGLGFLSLDESLSKGDLKGLENLWGLYADNTIEEYQKIIPNIEGILELGIEDSIFKKSLDGIEGFPNLQYLSVAYDSLEDISALSELSNLRGLSLINCDRLTDYSPLLSLVNLESLHIESVQLKTIDFIQKMPNLASLSIKDSAAASLDALASCPKISSLSLVGNYSIEDYSRVGDLTQLTDLTLELSYGGDLPSFEKLSQLTTLSLKYAGDLSPLKDAVNVSYLSLERCAGWELEAIASMQELKTLEIHNFSSFVESLEPLTRLKKLEALDLSETSIFGNIEEIFNIPTLRYLYLDECQIGLDFDGVLVNHALECLSMNQIRILKDPTYNNGDMVKLSEHYEFFSKFPNLTELYLTSNQIDRIDFVGELAKLRFLDITDNSVTSLMPLADLTDFVSVWCGKNTILEKLPEDSGIAVIMD